MSKGSGWGVARQGGGGPARFQNRLLLPLFLPPSISLIEHLHYKITTQPPIFSSINNFEFCKLFATSPQSNSNQYWGGV